MQLGGLKLPVRKPDDDADAVVEDDIEAQVRRSGGGGGGGDSEGSSYSGGGSDAADDGPPPTPPRGRKARANSYESNDSKLGTVAQGELGHTPVNSEPSDPGFRPPASDRDSDGGAAAGAGGRSSELPGNRSYDWDTTSTASSSSHRSDASPAVPCISSLRSPFSSGVDTASPPVVPRLTKKSLSLLRLRFGSGERADEEDPIELVEITRMPGEHIGLSFRNNLVTKVEEGGKAELVDIHVGHRIVRIDDIFIHNNTGGYEVQKAFERAPETFQVELIKDSEGHEVCGSDATAETSLPESISDGELSEFGELFSLSPKQGTILLTVVIFFLSPVLVFLISLALAGFMALILAWPFEESFYLCASIVISPLGGQPMLTQEIAEGEYKMGGHIFAIIVGSWGVAYLGLLNLSTSPAIAPLFSWTTTMLQGEEKKVDDNLGLREVEELADDVAAPDAPQDFTRKMSKWRINMGASTMQRPSKDLIDMNTEQKSRLRQAGNKLIIARRLAAPDADYVAPPDAPRSNTHTSRSPCSPASPASPAGVHVGNESSRRTETPRRMPSATPRST